MIFNIWHKNIRRKKKKREKKGNSISHNMELNWSSIKNICLEMDVDWSHLFILFILFIIISHLKMNLHGKRITILSIILFILLIDLIFFSSYSANHFDLWTFCFLHLLSISMIVWTLEKMIKWLTLFIHDQFPWITLNCYSHQDLPL